MFDQLINDQPVVFFILLIALALFVSVTAQHYLIERKWP